MITERAVEPWAVVEDLDVPEDFAFCFGARGEDPISSKFAFERSPEALHPGVVVAVTRPPHTRDDLMMAQQFAVGIAGILASTIRVVEQPGRGPLCLDGALESTRHPPGGAWCQPPPQPTILRLQASSTPAT